MNNLESQLQQKFDNFLKKVSDGLDTELNTSHYEEGFEGRVTHRVSGEVVEADRNTVDTGNLRDSQTITKTDPLAALVDYSTEYASHVYFIDGGGRPWIERYVSQIGKQGFQDLFKES